MRSRRRLLSADDATGKVLQAGPLALDLAGHSASLDGAPPRPHADRIPIFWPCSCNIRAAHSAGWSCLTACRGMRTRGMSAPSMRTSRTSGPSSGRIHAGRASSKPSSASAISWSRAVSRLWVGLTLAFLLISLAAISVVACSPSTRPTTSFAGMWCPRSGSGSQPGAVAALTGFYAQSGSWAGVDNLLDQLTPGLAGGVVDQGQAGPISPSPVPMAAVIASRTGACR